MPDPSRFPLAWPLGWPRTIEIGRQRSRFTSHGRDITISAAVSRLEEELDRLGAHSGMMSSNLKLGVSGVPLSNQAEPRDRGVAIYFRLKGHDRVLACDRYLSVAANIAAIAAHIDALRRIERYGVGTIEQAFAGYTALPPPSDENRPPWRKMFGFQPTEWVTEEALRKVYRHMAKQAINDEEVLKTLNLARDAALRELGATP